MNRDNSVVEAWKGRGQSERGQCGEGEEGHICNALNNKDTILKNSIK